MPLNSQLNTQINKQLNTQINKQLNTQLSSSSPQGIYLLGNDAVLGQLQALFGRLNHHFSQNHCAPLPVCIIPSNDDLRSTRQWVAQHASLSLFDNPDSMAEWEAFARSVWAAQPVVARLSQHSSHAYEQVRSFRRFCAFDGEFDQFVFCDARSQSTHGLDQLEEVLIQLQTHEFVLDDWEHLKAEPTALLDISYVGAALDWSEGQLRERLHGASFFASHGGLLGAKERKLLLKQLIEDDEIRWLNPLSWWNDGALFSYMTLRSGEQGKARSLYNFARPHCPVHHGLSAPLEPLPPEMMGYGFANGHPMDGDFLCNFLPEHLWAQRQAIGAVEVKD